MAAAARPLGVDLIASRGRDSAGQLEWLRRLKWSE
jgi:hypothetical protein